MPVLMTNSGTVSDSRIQHGFALQKELEALARRSLEEVGSNAYAEFVRMVEELACRVAVTSEKASSNDRHVEQFRSLLCSIASNASRIQEDRHEHLLRTLFKLKLWLLPGRVQEALADLLVHLTWVRIGLQDACIKYLVSSFAPPLALEDRTLQRGNESTKEPHCPSPAELSAHTCALGTLNKLIMQQPLCTRLVNDALDQHFPHRFQPRQQLCSHVRAMLLLAEMPAGNFLQDSTFEILIRRLVEIDAEIRWEGIVEQLRGQEDEEVSDGEDINPDDLHTAAALLYEGERMDGVSDGEMDCAGEDGAARVGSCTRTAALLGTAEDTQLGFEGHARQHRRRLQPQHAEDDVGPTSSLEMAHRLDPLMKMLFEHMRVRAQKDPSRLWRDCMHVFDSILLGSQRVKFTPYVVIFAAHMTGVANASKFAADLVARVCNPAESKVRRMTCAAYLGSFLARFAPLPLPDVTCCLEKLIRFAAEYAASTARWGGLHRCASTLHTSREIPGSTVLGRSFSTGAFEVQGSKQDQHDVFYASCQAAMYSVCFHGNCLSSAAPLSGDASVTATAEQCSAFRSLVQSLLIPLMSCPLSPLQACLPTVTDEFIRTVARHVLGDLSQLATAAAPGGSGGGPRRKVRCDTYFPFDPYLLPLSAADLKVQSFYRNWRHGVPACHMHRAHAAGGGDVEGCSDSDDDSTSDGDSDEEDGGMVGSMGTGKSLDAPTLASSADKLGAQGKLVNPFAGAPRKHVAIVRCAAADESMGTSPPSDGCESPAYGSLGPTHSSPGAFRAMSLK